ncbi:hypothetical protein P9112_007578 [Eukaryota sp. TZLM1-RC]
MLSILRFDDAHDVVYGVLAALYIIFFIVSSVFLYLHLGNAPKRWSIHFWLLFFVFLNASIRTVFLILELFFEIKEVDDQTPIARFFTEFLIEGPAVICYSTFSLLIYYLRDLCHAAGSTITSSNRMKHFFVWSNIVFYIAAITMWVYVGIDPVNQDWTLKASAILFMTACLLASLGFMCYGVTLVLSLKRFPIVSVFLKKQMKKVAYVTAISAVCFLVRGLFQFISMLDDDPFGGHAIVVLLYYFLLDVLPYAVLLSMLKEKWPKRRTLNTFNYIRV